MLKRTIVVLGEKIIITPLFLLVGFVIVLRIPSLFEPYWYGDEAIYLTLGEAVRQGLVLYRDIFDHKPPLVYLLAAIGGSLFWFKFILLVWHAASVVLFWKLVEKFFVKRKAVLFASVIFALLTTIPLLEGNLVNSELLMAGTTIAAFFILFGEKLTVSKLFGAGLLLSLSILLKVPSVFDFLAISAFWVYTIYTKRDLLKVGRNIFFVGFGVLLPILASVVYYWSQGALTQYIDTAWSRNFTYISRWSSPDVSFLATIAQVGFKVRAFIFLVVLFLLFVFRRKFDQIVLFSSLWFMFSLFAALLSGRPYPHYIIQVVPSLSLLLTLLAFGRERVRFLPLPFLLLFLFTLVFYKFGYYPTFSYYENFLSFVMGQKDRQAYFEYFDKKTTVTYKLAEMLMTRTAKDERVFIWGTMPELYALSRRLPPGRYVTSFHISDFDGFGETIQALGNKPPRYIIVIHNEQTDFAEFFDFLQRNYIFLETVGEASVWKLPSPGIMKALYR